MDYLTRMREIDRQLYRNNQFIRSLEARVPAADPYDGELENLVDQIQQLKDVNHELAVERMKCLSRM